MKRRQHALYCYDDGPDVTDEENEISNDESTQSGEAIFSATRPRGKKKKMR